MKVLSIKAPFASLIKNKIKSIETRSWRTNYRGELYIHASLSVNKKRYNELKDLITTPLECGYIICKCELTDCKLMTKEFIENIKRESPTEYLCGEYKEGRYAWILTKVTPIKKIKAKGALSIWNYQE